MQTLALTLLVQESLLDAQAVVLEHLQLNSDLHIALKLLKAGLSVRTCVCVCAAGVYKPLPVHVQGLTLTSIRHALEFGYHMFAELGRAFAGRASLEPLLRQLVIMVSCRVVWIPRYPRRLRPHETCALLQRGRSIAWLAFLHLLPTDSLKSTMEYPALSASLWPCLTHSVASELMLAFVAGAAAFAWPTCPPGLTPHAHDRLQKRRWAASRPPLAESWTPALLFLHQCRSGRPASCSDFT